MVSPEQRSPNLFPADEESTREVNRILDVILEAEDKKPNAVLYVGRKQYYALKTVNYAGRMSPLIDDKFHGWPVVRVDKEDWLRFAE